MAPKSMLPVHGILKDGDVCIAELLLSLMLLLVLLMLVLVGGLLLLFSVRRVRPTFTRRLSQICSRRRCVGGLDWTELQL